ncbi:MAG: hypothetical protein P1V13_12470 [Rhizobiaceae bacterium]|nr:hypothetical protein [Rhizobiaceae bacterium]
MAHAQTSRSFWDTPYARLLALVVAALIAFLLYSNWANDIGKLLSGDAGPIPIAAKPSPVTETNPALANCLEKRVGDVEQMKQEGIINDAQYASFKARATDLCQAQHPL